MKISRVNREWHKKNRMPQNPSLEQRLEWHQEHAKHCQCRPIPDKILAELRRRQMDVLPQKD